MIIELSEADAGFLAEVAEALAPFAGLENYVVTHGRDAVDGFYRALAERNWLALSWPKAVGGLDRPLLHEFLLWNEAAFLNIARPPQGAGIVAKTIIRHGTDAQKDLWLGRIRAHEATFALAYSEPEAGSDLANVRCRATRDGDDYILDGNKCWNSKAHLVDYLWLLCRTGDTQARRDGLSLMIVDARLPGVRIRPIPLMDGNFVSEIIFDDVRIPAECRVGPEHEAWRMMGESLADERHVHFSAGRVRRDYLLLKGWLADNGRLADPVVRRTMDMLAVDVLEAEALCLVALASPTRSDAGPAANKVSHVRAIQQIARAALDLGGMDALVSGAPPELHWRQTMTESIGGGTAEIMEGIVARQRLGLKASL